MGGGLAPAITAHWPALAGALWRHAVRCPHPFPLPPPPCDPGIVHDTDAVCRITLCGICGSDLHPFFGKERGIQAGTVVGHEFVGIVEEVGPQVRVPWAYPSRWHSTAAVLQMSLPPLSVVKRSPASSRQACSAPHFSASALEACFLKRRVIFPYMTFALDYGPQTCPAVSLSPPNHHPLTTGHQPTSG